MALDTDEVRERLERIEEEIDGELVGYFDALIEPLNDVNGVLESKFLKRFLAEFGKLRHRVEELSERIKDCRDELETHDNELEDALGDLVDS